MSNAPNQPENAASAALVSPDRTARCDSSSASVPVSAPPPPPPPPNDRTDDIPPPEDKKEEEGSATTTTTTTTTPVAPPAEAYHGTGIPEALPQSTPDAGLTVAPAPHADPIKYGRGPAVLQRPPGPSLLSQALATARGIPRPGQPEPSHTTKPHTSPSVSHQDTPESHQHTCDTRHGPSRHGDGDVLAPRRSSPRTPNMSSVTTVATTVAPPVFKGRLDLGEVNSMLNGHREYLKGALGEGDNTRTRDRVSRAHTYSSDTPGSNPPFTDSPTAIDIGAADENLPIEPRPQATRAWKTDHRVSMGPEKAWSIGIGESASGEDGGQVEKSITEVLAGVEPNARSRKASHSLRFFKEGLPEEKVKRKDTRSGTHKTSGLGESVAAGDEGDAEKTPAPEDGSLVSSRPSRAKTIPRTPDIGETIKESPEDYFLCKQSDLAIQFSPAKPAVSPRKLGPSDRQQVLDLTAPRTEQRRESDASGGAGDSALEEGEESGEEKIQSAVFLPHQVPEQPQEHVPTPRIAPAGTLSRHDDFHPWLVRTDEPEVDQSEEGVQVEKKQLRSEPVGSSSIASELDTQPDGPTAADESAAPSSKPSRPVSQYIEENIHDHQLEHKQPLEAIELIPYKHQVGGHTTLWRFSRRAVCKQLNNRENEFYEKIEQYHRDLLAFLPRYIGVLNVTFQKLPRRKSTMRRDDAAASERDQNGSNGTAQKSLEPESANDRPRLISQSLQSDSRQIPTVTFVDNQHILPRNLLQPLPSVPIPGRYRSASATAQGAGSEEPVGPVTPPRHVLARPTLHDRHANSWGATTVNKRLRNEVFNDAFLKQPIAIHRHRKGHQRPLPRRSLQQALRQTGSDPSLTQSHEKKAQTAEDAERLPKLNGINCLTQSQSDLGRVVADFVEDEEPAPKDVTGTSAPEPEILGDSSPAALKKKRRYSGTGLRRKPNDVRDDRGSLKYFEEADEVGYKGNRGEIMPNTPHKPQSPLAQPALEAANGQQDVPLSAVTSAETSELPSPSAEFKKIPRPINPKEAQTQRDSRVEYFLLLEDLTAGMKRPCIMDLKMGTRQYGVDANPKKQKSQQGKCAKTTSRELGVRVCGLQVWDVKSQSYVFKDKYYGREIKKGQEFQDALSRFLYDGVDPASILRHIPTVLRKLDELEVIVSRLDGYRFYAASLLMFYDGDTSSDNYDQSAIEDSTTDFATDTEEAPRRSKKSKRDIDFKIADFANCITPYDSMEDKACPPRHPGEPDRGFMRGLRSLRKYFLKIQRDTRAGMGLVLRGNGNGGTQPDLLFEESEDEGEVSE
ncbi:inositol hexakisphosphate kinase 1 [Podospora australis]|uniref:Kinase n=1 Tax=Podospora australis TaxID=1536484 RepID=A0AAN7AJE1_9PEZI|nr:inositol hexakisphosphate kinase 1 [Podospora australis]